MKISKGLKSLLIGATAIALIPAAAAFSNVSELPIPTTPPTESRFNRFEGDGYWLYGNLLPNTQNSALGAALTIPYGWKAPDGAPLTTATLEASIDTNIQAFAGLEFKNYLGSPGNETRANIKYQFTFDLLKGNLSETYSALEMSHQYGNGEVFTAGIGGTMEGYEGVLQSIGHMMNSETQKTTIFGSFSKEFEENNGFSVKAYLERDSHIAGRVDDRLGGELRLDWNDKSLVMGGEVPISPDGQDASYSVGLEFRF